MTLPTLVNKYQDRVNETRYKKALSMVSQAVQLSMAEVDSPGNMTNTDLWACKDIDNFDEALQCFSRETKKLFKNIALDNEGTYDKMSYTSGLWDDTSYTFTIGDGMAFGYITDEDSLKVIVDTNAASKPNNISKDLYLLQILPNGKVVDVTESLAGGGSGNIVDCGERPDWYTATSIQREYDNCQAGNAKSEEACRGLQSTVSCSNFEWHNNKCEFVEYDC